MPQPHHQRKLESQRKQLAPRITYKDINELSKKVFMEDLQRKWIKRERILGKNSTKNMRKLIGNFYNPPLSNHP